MWRSDVVVAFLGVATVAALACKTGSRQQSLEGDPSAPSCGFELVSAPTSRPLDACTRGGIVAGPTRVDRTAGPPATETLEFTVPHDGTLCVRVVNGDPSTSRVSAADIELDGETVFGPDAFNPHVLFLQDRRTIARGNHTVAVRVRSKPGSFLDVAIRHADESTSPHNPIVGSADLLTLFDLFAAPRSFTPDGDGFRDETSLQVVAEVAPAALDSHRPANLELETKFEITSGTSCESVQSLQSTTTVAGPGTWRVDAVWDGTDANGTGVSAGAYFYRASAQLVRISPNGDRTPIDAVITQIQTVLVASDDTPPLPEPPTSPPRRPGQFSRTLPGIATRPVPESEASARLVAQAAAFNASRDPIQLVTRFRDAAPSGAPALLKISLVADDGPVAGQDLRISRWAVEEQLGGPAVPSPFRLRQSTPGGLIVSDSMLVGSPGRTYVVVVDHFASDEYVLTGDRVSHSASFASPVPAGWQFEKGPIISELQLQQVAGGW